MTDAMTFDPSPDVLYHGVTLRHVMELPVLGVPVRFESNSAAALAVVEEAFGIWRGLPTSPGLIGPAGVRNPRPLPLRNESPHAHTQPRGPDRTLPPHRPRAR